MGLMQRKNKKSPFKLPSNTELQRFEKRNIGGPTKKDFRVQLVGSLACHWNDRAAAIFAKTYIKKKGRDFKDDDLVACFKVHLRTLRNQYERINPNSRNTQAEHQHRKTSARRTRRQGVSFVL